MTCSLAAAALTLSASTASATYPGANGRIAYTLSLNNVSPSHIHTIQLDGSGDQDLGVGSDPAWSSDGKRIVFVRGRHMQDIFVMNADGTHQERVTATPYQSENDPHFAPGGHRLVFDRYPRGGPYVIGSISLDGSHYERLARDGRDPEFSPDGRHIVYASGGIWVMRRDGSHKRRLTDDKRDVFPDYRPGGRRIIFIDFFTGGPQYINLDGSAAPGPCDGQIYSPDGTRVAWSKVFGRRLGGDPHQTKGSNIWTTWAAPGRPCNSGRRVTHYERDPGYGYAYDPSWQPLPSG